MADGAGRRPDRRRRVRGQTALQAVPFEGRTWPTYALNVGYNVVALAGIGGLLAVW